MAPTVFGFLLLLTSVSSNLFFGFSSPRSLKILPTKKIVVLAGSEVRLNCTLSTNRSDITVHNITWQANHTYISSEHYQVVDQFTSQLTVDHVPLGSLAYHCVITGVYITSKMLQGGYPPALPTNFSCVSPNWTSMTCSWHPIKMNYGIKTAFMMYYKIEVNCSNDGNVSHCPHPNPDMNSCTWLPLDEGRAFSPALPYCMWLDASNELGSVGIRKAVDPEIIVKPGLVSKVTWQVANTSIHIEWAYPTDMISQDVIRLTFLVLYRSQWDSPTTWKNITTDDTNVWLTGLTPYTTYTIKIRTKPKRGLYWSDDWEKGIQTLTSVPGESPPSSLGSYWSSRVHNGLYSVDLYWKPVPLSKQHGVITDIIIQEYKDSDIDEVVYKTSGEVNLEESYEVAPRPKSETKLDGNAIQSTMRGLNAQDNYTFLIQAATLDGPSRFPTIIYVPKQSRDYARPVAVMSEMINASDYLVTWILDPRTSSADVESVTVHWCDGAQRQTQDDVKVTCLNDYNWVTASSSATEQLVSLSFNPLQEVQFGVSLIQSGFSVGIRWGECLFRHNDDMEPPVPRFDAAPNGKQGQITLNWHLSCDAFPSRPLQYQFVYAEVKSKRKVTCSGQMVNVTAVSVHGSLDISGLLAMTNYSVCMRTVTKHGVGRFSEPQFASVVNLVPPSNLTAAALNGSAVALSWQPAVGKDSVVHYKIVSEPSVNRKKVNGTASSVILDDLWGYTSYRFSLEACLNDLICSISSEPVIATTTIRGSSEVDFDVTSYEKNSGKVTIDWNPPEHPNGPIDHYVVSWSWKVKETEKNVNATVPGNLTSKVVNIGCLSSGAGFTVAFTVWAVNVDGLKEFQGKRNAPRNASICSYHGSNTKIIIIVVVVIGIIPVVILVVFLGKKCKNFFGREVIVIKVPEPLNNQYADNYERYLEREDTEDQFFIADKIEKESDSDDSSHYESSKMIHSSSQRESGFAERMDSISKASSSSHPSESDSAGSNTNVNEMADAALSSEIHGTNNVRQQSENQMPNLSEINMNDQETNSKENLGNTMREEVLNNDSQSENQQSVSVPPRENSGLSFDEVPVDLMSLFQSLNIASDLDAGNVNGVPQDEGLRLSGNSHSNYSKNYVEHPPLPDKDYVLYGEASV